MVCANCGATLREGARFCPACGFTTEGFLPPSEEQYRYETTEKLFPWNAVVPIILLVWLPFTAIGVLVTLAEGFWFVPVIMSTIVLLAIFLVAWLHKGKKKKWGVDRTLWIFTPEGYGAGHPPDVARRIGLAGITSAAMTVGRQNLAVTLLGLNMARDLTIIEGLPIIPWTDFSSAEYRPNKREIALHKTSGNVSMIYANPDNYAYVEQLVRGHLKAR